MIEQAQWYKDLKKKHERDPKYWVEYLKLVFSEDVGYLMEKRNVNQAELARRLDTSRAYVTRMFRGTFNPTVETMVKFALALDARVELHLRPVEAVWTQWYDLIPAVDTTPAAKLWADSRELVKVSAARGTRDASTSTIRA